MVKLLVTLALLASAASAAGAPIDPRDFEVNLSGAPPLDQPQPECTGQYPELSCSVSFSTAVNGFHINGSVKERSTGRTGSITTTCDFDLQFQASLQISGSSIQSSHHGSGGQRCSWYMDFGGGSTLTGTFVGQMKMDIENGSGTMTGSLTVAVTAGTGDFDGKVGSGTFQQSEQISQPVPTPPTGTPPGGEPPGGGGLPPGCVLPSDPDDPLPPECKPPPFRVLAVSAAGSKLKLKLRTGKPTAAIAAPGPKLDADRDGGLRVVSARGATCSAVAKQGSRSVDLGKASDSNRDGLVVVTPKLLPKLGPGSWTLVATCSWRAGAKTGTATARATTRV
ncbi:MAG: hypothetical protein WD689_11060 [Gaiellaceae bacterium]